MVSAKNAQCGCALSILPGGIRHLAATTCLWSILTASVPVPIHANHVTMSILAGVCSIGAVYRNMGENEKALESYNKSLEIKIKVHG